ncbi:hypothetical protein H5410_005938 [Solanum commersonii]|uniref:Uncharacterized protein n=1 Tax=Solanum commersonii TaxID=4109 RepID=A0A9J6A8H5_SOLCO|nr:hypothetical protein H5410_005938 [Solanum commersonii]
MSSSPQIDRVDVSSQPFDENENRDLNQNQSLLVEEQSPAPRVEEYSDSDSLYDVDGNIDDLSDLDEELLQARQSNIQEQVKEKADRVNLDEIPSGPVDPSSDISEDKGDPVENDEVVDPALRKESTKIYFDPTTKKCARHIWANWKKDWMGEERRSSNRLPGHHLRKNVEIADNYEVKFNGDLVFEIHDPPYKHVVDLKKKKIATAGTNVATSIVVAGTSVASVATVGNAATLDFTNAVIGSQSSVNVGLSTGPSAGCTPSDMRQLSTQQSTSSATGQKRKTSTTLKGGATIAYKKSRPKKEKTAGYGLLFGSGDSVTERSGNTDRVLHSATLSSLTPTNIDLGYKPNRLRWKGRVAITQRQL